jgi:hypothetical protein
MGAAINSALPLFDENETCADNSAKFQLELVGQQVVEFARMRADARADVELGVASENGVQRDDRVRERTIEAPANRAR